LGIEDPSFAKARRIVEVRFFKNFELKPELGLMFRVSFEQESFVGIESRLI
jgi:hypothetical protein